MPLEVVDLEVHRPAGFWIRLGASILDNIIIGIGLSILGFIFFGYHYFSGHASFNFLDLIRLVYSIVLPVYWNGYVIGKRLCGIRIVKLDGTSPTIGVMLLRVLVGGLVYFCSLGICLIISAFMVGLRDDKRSIHDFIAGTYVTYDRPGENSPE